MIESRSGNGQESWRDDFPMEESYTSASGQKITFRIGADESPMGFRAFAEETEESRGDRSGYRFTVFSPIDPYLALGEIRGLIRSRLATRYVDRSDGYASLTHDELVGVIDYSEDDGGIVLQVDGEKVTMGDLGQILSAYEGREIRISIRET